MRRRAFLKTSLLGAGVIYLPLIRTSSASEIMVTPATFASVIAGTSGAPMGSTFLLQPGDYDAPNNAAWICTLNGAAGTPYTFKGGIGVRIGPIQIQGVYTTWEDVEFAYPHWTTRYSPTPGSNPPGVFGWARLSLYGRGTILRRCVAHDLADFGWGADATDSLIEDCLMYNIGWEASDRAHGHGCYIQNTNVGPKVMRRCVSLLCYASPTKIYGVNGALENVTIEDSVFAFGKEGYFYVRSDNSAAHNITLRNLYTFGLQWQHMNYAPGGGPITVDGGVIVSDIDWYAYEGFKNWQGGASVRGLQVIGRRAVSLWHGAAPAGWIDESAYHIIPPSSQNYPFGAYGVYGSTSLAQWQAQSGNDLQSTYSTALPAEPRIEVIERSSDRVVVVYNWNGAASVLAPVAGVYRNAMNMGESVTLHMGDPLPMDSWSTSTPMGADAPVAAWDSRFGVFLVGGC